MLPGPPILRYAAAWLVAGAVVVAATLLLTGGRTQPPVDERLPAVQQADLPSAARAGRCTLVVARRGQRLNPPVDGAPARRAPAVGSYDTPLPTADLLAALQQGRIVIHYRADLDEEVVAEVRRLQRGLPKSTIVVPNATGMRYAVAATAHRRLLGCRTYNAVVRDAVRLFRGRYVGLRARG